MRISLLTVLLCFAINDAAFANTKNITETQFISQLNDVLNQLNRIPSPWPAFNLQSNPIITTFANQHNYAYFFAPQNPNWVKIADQPATYYLNHDEYQIDQIPWSYGNRIDGQTAFIFNFDMAGAYNAVTLHTLFHERFHIFQFANFPSELYSRGIYDGFNNIENVKLTLIEDAALINYLNSNNLEDLKNYAAISQFRASLIGKQATDYETKKENLEGLADYYSWSVIQGGNNLLNSVITATHQQNCNTDNLIKCQMHLRYYFTGNITAIALNELSKDSWRDKLVKNKVSLRDQLLQYFHFSPFEIKERVSRSKVIYHYEDITRPIAEAISDYKIQRSKEMATYQQSKGMTLNIERTACNLFSSILVVKEYYLDSDTTLVMGSNGNSICQDKSIMVNYFHTPFLFNRESNGRIQLKISADTIINIDGNAITATELMNGNKDYTFTNLYLKTDTIEVKVTDRPGKLTTSDRAINLITSG